MENTIWKIVRRDMILVGDSVAILPLGDEADSMVNTLRAVPVMIQSLRRIADMRDRDGNAVNMHRDELRGIARNALFMAGLE